MGVLGVLIFAAFQLGSITVLAECPHKDDSLESWSDANTWDGAKPSTGDQVVIEKPVLMDEPSLDLFSINITSTGRLVWSPDVDIDLRVRYIWVNGRLDIGSEDCPYDGKTTITLTGNRKDSADHKVIMVDDGGTLELHGKKKLSWTKLDKTANKLADSGELLYDQMTDDRNEVNKDSFAMVAYSVTLGDDDTFTIRDFGVYNLYHRAASMHIINTERLAQQMENITDGEIFMMATKRYNPVYDRYIPTRAYDAFETMVYGEVTNSSIFREINRPDTYAMIFQKGNSDSFQEVKGVLKDSVVYYDAPNTNLSFHVHCYADIRDYRQYENFQIMTRNGRYPVLDVIDDVTTWRPGDKIVLTSTDYDWEQAEEKTVVECFECNNKQVRIDSALDYMHWGEMVEEVVDQRGEVALLSRNIVIHGEMADECPADNGNCKAYPYDTFGGHIKVLNGFSDVHIEGIEVYNAGQQTDLGRYPIHFHMCLNTSHSEPYIRDCSIHDTFARCITIHGTHGVKVEDNVCYRSLGHSYFLEDGSEMYNTFDGNIAIGTLEGSLIPTDIEEPTSFWITNPLTYVRNNVAAGGEHAGFWYVFPIEPLGPSKDLKILEEWEASRTRLLDCENNVAHSNNKVGFIMEEHLDAKGVMQQTNRYQPRVDPRDEESDYLPINIDRITAYKNRLRNIWLEGGYVNLRKSSSADSLTGISIFNTQNRDKHGTLTKTVIVGESENTGEPDEWMKETLPRSFPLKKATDYPRKGYAFYKGPHNLEDIYFAGFEKNDYYNSGAISFQLNNIYFTGSQSSIKNALYAFEDSASSGNRVFHGIEGEDPYFTSWDGDKSVHFRDLDTGLWIMKPDPFTVVDGCVLRPNWKMAMCTQKYAKIRPSVSPMDARDETNLVMVRDDLPSAQMEFNLKKFAGFPVAIGGEYSYTMVFTEYFPQILNLDVDGVEKDGWVRIGVCLPLDAEFNIQQWRGLHRAVRISDWTNVTSLEELDEEDDNSGTKFYHDQEKGVLYFVLHHDRARAENGTTDCPEAPCPYIRITLLGGTASDSDCRQRLYTEEQYNISIPTLPQLTDPIPANVDGVPEGWGAGPTRPFLSRATMDGGYSDWTEWNTCSKSCGGGLQSRERLCDSPPPANGGLDCDGPRSENQICNDDPCPIDGGFSEWSNWTDCSVPALCSGSRSRTRSCSNPAPEHEGAYCSGSVEEIETCQTC